MFLGMAFLIAFLFVRFRTVLTPGEGMLAGFIIDSSGHKVVGLDGRIKILTYRGDEWIPGSYDGASGGYEVTVPAGGDPWFLVAQVDENTGFTSSQITPSIAVPQKGTIKQDLMLHLYGGALAVKAISPTGSYLDNILLNLRNIFSGELFSHEVSEGASSISVPTGVYEVNAYSADADVISSGASQVTVDSGSLANVNLAFQKSNTAVMCHILGPSGGTPGSVVRAWTESGAYRQVKSDSNGNCLLKLSTGVPWHISADAVMNDHVYRSQEIVTTISEPTTSVNLILDVTPLILPKAVSRTFKGNETATVSLSNGVTFSLPSGAVPSVSFTASIVPSIGFSPAFSMVTPVYDLKILTENGPITKLAKYGVIKIPYTATDFIAKASESFLHTFSFDHLTSVWRSDGNSVVYGNAVISLTNYLAAFVVGHGQGQAQAGGVQSTEPPPPGSLSFSPPPPALGPPPPVAPPPSAASSSSDTTPPVIGSNLLVNVSGTSATVTFTTNEPSSSEVKVGASTVTNPNFTLVHFVAFTNLPANVSLPGFINARDIAGNAAQQLAFTLTTGAVSVTPPATVNPASAGLVRLTLPSSFPSTFRFGRSINAGTSGIVDVLRLQQFLNSLSCCKVAISGAGSPGNETQFYGPRTTVAIQKFQVTYFSTTLIALGIPNGAPNFGPLSRKTANDILNGVREP